jgi:hypothetical protein
MHNPLKMGSVSLAIIPTFYQGILKITIRQTIVCHASNPSLVYSFVVFRPI